MLYDYCHMRPCIVLDFGYRHIVIWHLISWTNNTVHVLVIISRLLMAMHERSYRESTNNHPDAQQYGMAHVNINQYQYQGILVKIIVTLISSPSLRIHEVLSSRIQNIKT